MSALVYLLRREIINGIKQMFRRPLLPIFYIVLMGFFIFSAYLNISDPTEIDLDRFEIMLGYLQAGGFALFGFVFLTTLLSSMSGGATLFGMSDVNFLFTSPVSPQKIIIYGVLRQGKQSFLITLLFLFQIPVLANYFNMGARGIAGFLLAWFMLLMAASLSSMTLFALSSKSTTIRKIITVILVMGLLTWIAGLIVSLVVNGATLNAMVDYVCMPIMDYIPFVGWSIAFMMATIDGDLISALLFILLNLFVPLLGIEYMRRSRMDYFEDVLGKTEKTFLTMQAAKEGKQVSDGSKVKESRMRKLGLAGKGQGASTFFWRQMTEFRRNMFFIFDGTSVLTLIAALIGALFLRYNINSGAFGMFRAQFYAVGAGVYLLYFITVAGKFSKEMKKTYIYLIPASRFKKLFYAIFPQILKTFIEGFAGFAILVIIAGLPIWILALGPMLYASFSGVYVAVLLFAKWITGEGVSKLVESILFFLAGGIIVGPAVLAYAIPFIILVERHPSLIFIPYLISFLVAILLFMVVLALCRGVLDKFEA